mgnify:CR=1 FL=1
MSCKPSAKVLEAQQSPQTQTTVPQAIQTRRGAAAVQLPANDEPRNAPEHLPHHELPPFPTGLASLPPSAFSMEATPG